MQHQYHTPRLLLRAFVAADAPEVRRIAGRPEVALTTLNVPHPYAEGLAEGWIASHNDARASGSGFTYAVVLRDGGLLVGATSLVVTSAHGRGELAYWVDPDHWNRGYATEAARVLVDEAFVTLGLGRVYSAHFAANPASGRVLTKLGLRHEGTLRAHFLRLGSYHDTLYYGLLRSEWQAGASVAGRT